MFSSTIKKWANNLSLRHLKGPESQPIILNKRRIYIMPSAFGSLFGLVLFIMLFGSVNYNNNMGFAVTFLLASVGIISIIHSNANLSLLSIRATASNPSFCGEPARFYLHISTKNASEKYSISAINEFSEAQTDVLAHETSKITIKVPTKTRGYINLGKFRISTDYPLGIVRAWSWLYPDAKCLVYPAPEVNAPAPDWMGDSAANINNSDAIDDFQGFRHYQPGDSPKHIFWKRFPMTDTLLTKQFASGHEQDRWLNWSSVADLPIEQAVSRLTQWVLHCSDSDLKYGLILPDKKIDFGNGESHRHNCLKALALYNPGSND